MENYIGKRLSKTRKAKNLTQQQFSDRVGMSVSEISRIETGKITPTLDAMLRFCEELNIGLDYLLYDYFPKKPSIPNPEIREIISLPEPLNEHDISYLLKSVRLFAASYADSSDSESQM